MGPPPGRTQRRRASGSGGVRQRSVRWRRLWAELPSGTVMKAPQNKEGRGRVVSGWRHVPFLEVVPLKRLKISQFLETCCFLCWVTRDAFQRVVPPHFHVGHLQLLESETSFSPVLSRSHKSLCVRISDYRSVPSSFGENFHSTLGARLLVAVFLFILRQLALHLQPSCCCFRCWCAVFIPLVSRVGAQFHLQFSILHSW